MKIPTVEEIRGCTCISRREGRWGRRAVKMLDARKARARVR